MKTFDIDALDPGYSSPLKPSRRKKQEPWMKRVGWVHLTGYPFKGPGINFTKMCNWRALERRSHELDVMWNDASNFFWKAVEKMNPPVEGNHQPGLFVVIDPPHCDGIKVLDVSSTGYSINWQDRMLEELMQSADAYGDFRFVSYDDGGRELGRLYHRMERLIQARGIYKSAFRRAVSDRLTRFNESRTIPGARYRYLEPVIFMIENEGRYHVVTSGTGGDFTWHGGEVLGTSSKAPG